MRAETEIRTQIKAVTNFYQYILDLGPATVVINAPRALMQITAKEKLETLYWVLGEERPKFKCDDETLTDH